MSAIKFRGSLGPLTAIGLWLALGVPTGAFSQSVNQCADAASLRLPADNRREKVVAKWQTDVTFAIISHESGAAAVELIEATMRSLARQTGLKIKEIGHETTLPDLLLVVDPNVANDASLLRDLALKFFQSRFNLAGRLQIDADGWNAKLRSAVPKCIGLDVEIMRKSCRSSRFKRMRLPRALASVWDSRLG